MPESRLDIEEYDEAGELVATYVQSLSKRSERDAARVDVVVSCLPAFKMRWQCSTNKTRYSFRAIPKQYGTSAWTCSCRPGILRVSRMTI